MNRSLSLIASPCIRNCCLDKHDVCMGCLRSLEDILVWGSADDQRKLAILEQAQKRKELRQEKYNQKDVQKHDDINVNDVNKRS